MKLIDIDSKEFVIEMNNKVWYGDFELEWDDDMPICRLLSLYITATKTDKLFEFSITATNEIEELIESNGNFKKQPQDEELMAGNNRYSRQACRPGAGKGPSPRRRTTACISLGVWRKDSLSVRRSSRQEGQRLGSLV